MVIQHFERFQQEELEQLRGELRGAGLDSFQCGSLIAVFLASKGYGVSTEAARDAYTQLNHAALTVPNLQTELEKLASYM